VRGLAAWQQLFGAYVVAFPNMQITLANIIAEGMMAVVRYAWSATHQGSFMGLPATHKPVSEVAGIGVCRIVNGQIAEEWIVEDTLDLLQQLGAVPTPRAGAAATT